MKKIMKKIFVEAMSGFALGLFPTLIAGTILGHIGLLLGTDFGRFLVSVADVVKSLTGAGIGIGVAIKLNAENPVIASAAVAGYIGEYSAEIIDGKFVENGTINIGGIGLPLGAFFASYAAVEIGRIFRKKKKYNYLYQPAISIALGALVGFLVARPLTFILEYGAEFANWGMSQSPIVMGAVISVIMCIASTFQFGSVALAMMLNLTDLPAGAAAVGCCSAMIGFAVASLNDNGFEGFVLQSIGTSTLQLPNIFKRPIIYVPILLTSAILGPMSVCWLKVPCDTIGAGLGSCGFVAQIMTYGIMAQSGESYDMLFTKIFSLQCILPAVIAWFLTEILRRRGYIKDGDMKINL